MEDRKTISMKDLNVRELMDKEAKLADISPDLPLRKWLYSWMLDPSIPGNFQRSFDKWIGLLIIANLFSLIFETVPGIYEPYKAWFEFFDLFSIAIFTVEYLLRFYLSAEDAAFKGKVSSRLAYVLSPFAIIDALAIVPFYLVRVFGLSIDLHVLKALRVLRLLKIFRIVIPAYYEFAAANRGRTFRQ